MAARSKAWVCCRLACRDCGFESRRGHGCLSVVSVVCDVQVEVSASGCSLVQRSPTECGREASIMRRPWPTGGCCAVQKVERAPLNNRKLIRHVMKIYVHAYCFWLTANRHDHSEKLRSVVNEFDVVGYST